MTNVFYKHTDSSGVITYVKTLSEARKLVNTRGGNYNIEYDRNLSTTESHARKNHRVNGDMR